MSPSQALDSVATRPFAGGPQPDHPGGQAGASLSIDIPAPSRRAHFVSPNTKLITVQVQQVTASPWPSPMPLQTMPIGPGPCVPLPHGGWHCAFDVTVKVGQDTFAFKTYASPQPVGTPLSELQSGIETVKPNPSPLSFTLEGVVSSVALDVPSPEPNTTLTTNAIPIATPGSFPLTVMPKDASGAQILTSTFTQPVGLSLGPANLGIALSYKPQCPTDKPPYKGSNIQITCAKDLAFVNVTYDGRVVQTGPSVDDTTVIAASPEPNGANGGNAAVLLQSNDEVVPLTNKGGWYYPGYLSAGPDGRIYFAYATGGTAYGLGRFDPLDPKKTMKQVTLSFAPSSLLVDSKGQIWVGGPGELACFTSITSTPAATVAITNETIDAIAQSGTTIWYAGQAPGGGLAAAGTVSQPTNCSGLPLSRTPTVQLGSSGFTPASIANAGTIGQNGSSVWIGGSLSAFPFDGQLYYVQDSFEGSVNPSRDFTANYEVNGVATDPAFNVSVALGSTGNGSLPGLVQAFPSGNSLFTVQPGGYPMGIGIYTGQGTTVQQMAVVDGFGGPHGAVDVVSMTPTVVPQYVPLTGSNYCDGTVYDKYGGVWVVCDDSTGNAAVIHPVYTSRWGAVPAIYSVLTFTTNFPNSNAIGIIEQSPQDSSPFSGVVTSGSVALTAAWPGGYTHDMPITIPFAGSSTVKITDKYGRSQILNFTALGNNGFARSAGLHSRRK